MCAAQRGSRQVSRQAADDADKKHLRGAAKKQYIGGAINRAKQEKAGNGKATALRSKGTGFSRSEHTWFRHWRATLTDATPLAPLFTRWKTSVKKLTDKELFSEANENLHLFSSRHAARRNVSVQAEIERRRQRFGRR